MGSLQEVKAMQAPYVSPVCVHIHPAILPSLSGLYLLFYPETFYFIYRDLIILPAGTMMGNVGTSDEITWQTYKKHSFFFSLSANITLCLISDGALAELMWSNGR